MEPSRGKQGTAQPYSAAQIDWRLDSRCGYVNRSRDGVCRGRRMLRVAMHVVAVTTMPISIVEGTLRHQPENFLMTILDKVIAAVTPDPTQEERTTARVRAREAASGSP